MFEPVIDLKEQIISKSLVTDDDDCKLPCKLKNNSMSYIKNSMIYDVNIIS